MIDEDLKTVVVGLLLVIAGFTVFQAFFSDRVVEPFSELGILGQHLFISYFFHFHPFHTFMPKLSNNM